MDSSWFSWECETHGVLMTSEDGSAAGFGLCPRQVFMADGITWYFCNKPVQVFIRATGLTEKFTERIAPSVHAIVPPVAQAGFDADEWERQQRGLDDTPLAEGGIIAPGPWHVEVRARDPHEQLIPTIIDHGEPADPPTIDMFPQVQEIVDNMKLGKVFRRILQTVDIDDEPSTPGTMVVDGTVIEVDDEEVLAIWRAVPPSVDPEDDPDSDTHWFEPDAYEDLKADLFDAYRAQAAPVAATMRILDVLEKHGVSIGVK